MAEPRVSIFYGPLSWFETRLGSKQRRYLPDIVGELDEERRSLKHVHVVEGREPVELEEEIRDRPDRVVALSSDYASVQEHAITNFVGLIRQIDPKHVWLHNPPSSVHAQMERAFRTKVEHFAYPTVERETLRRFRDEFADHLVGQSHVRRSVLAALYSLTTKRTKPVVLMFFGPSGVGKTETAQFINGLLGGELFRRQFSMFHSDKFASYLFGGTHSESAFARDLLDRSSGVILIDEFDKANPVFHSAFYELFDEGVFEDKNYRVKVGASLIICTSNYGSEREIRDALGDALFSRFDALVRFEPLSRSEIIEVTNRIIDSRWTRLSADEMGRIDRDSLKADFHQYADRFANVRRLSKSIDEAIALKLVDSVLADQFSVAPCPQ